MGKKTKTGLPQVEHNSFKNEEKTIKDCFSMKEISDNHKHFRIGTYKTCIWFQCYWNKWQTICFPSAWLVHFHVNWYIFMFANNIEVGACWCPDIDQYHRIPKWHATSFFWRLVDFHAHWWIVMFEIYFKAGAYINIK